MGARTYRELEVWQLADRLRTEVVKITTAEPVRRDFRFCAEIQSAARSVGANISEGFARFRPGEFVLFLRYARGSLAEVETYVRELRIRSLATPTVCDELDTLTGRTGAALMALIHYLQSDEATRRSRTF